MEINDLHTVIKKVVEAAPNLLPWSSARHDPPITAEAPLTAKVHTLGVNGSGLLARNSCRCGAYAATPGFDTCPQHLARFCEVVHMRHALTHEHGDIRSTLVGQRFRKRLRTEISLAHADEDRHVHESGLVGDRAGSHDRYPGRRNGAATPVWHVTVAANGLGERAVTPV